MIQKDDLQGDENKLPDIANIINRNNGNNGNDGFSDNVKNFLLNNNDVDISESLSSSSDSDSSSISSFRDYSKIEKNDLFDKSENETNKYVTNNIMSGMNSDESEE